MTKEQLEAPILINLGGTYKIPVDGERPKAGSITGDLRLASLDAFLHSLDSALSARIDTEQTTKSSLVDAIKVAIDKCSNGTRSRHKGLTLSISSKLNPETHELTYSFSVYKR